jgi:hypothetical protein
VRWWSVASAGSADKQGTPVKNRDGPAAVTERKKDGQIFFDHCPVVTVNNLGKALLAFQAVAHYEFNIHCRRDEKVRPDPARESEDLPTRVMWALLAFQAVAHRGSLRGKEGAC